MCSYKNLPREEMDYDFMIVDLYASVDFSHIIDTIPLILTSFACTSEVAHQLTLVFGYSCILVIHPFDSYSTCILSLITNTAGLMLANI